MQRTWFSHRTGGRLARVDLDTFSVADTRELPGLTAGAHALQVDYGGDAYYSPASQRFMLWAGQPAWLPWIAKQ